MNKGMLAGIVLLLATAGAGRGQSPVGVVEPPAEPAVDVIHPEKVLPDAASLVPPEDHAPEKAEPAPTLIWARAEYLLWFNKAANLPRLVTMGQTTDPVPGSATSPNSRVLIGGKLDYQERSGGRFTLGYYLDNSHCVGVEGSYLFLAVRDIDRPAVSPGNQVLARPFFNAQTRQQDVSLVAFPGLLSGAVVARGSHDMQAFDTNLSWKFMEGEKLHLEGLVGFRYWHLDEELGITEAARVSPGAPVFAGRDIRVSDFFGTENSFYGPQIGLRGVTHFKRLQLEVTTKVALGAIHEKVDIRGATFISGTPPTIADAGFLALASNRGERSQTDFAVIPEVGVNLGYRMTDNLQAYVGYSFMYWCNVVRPSDQIDPTLNPNLIPTSATFGAAGGANRPVMPFRESDFWVQGLNFGIELKF